MLAGVDACRAGWIAAVAAAGSARAQIMVYRKFSDLIDELGANAVIAVDMPIGLPDRIRGAGRGPEQAIRPLLGPRQSSVFSIPARAAVEAETYGEACARALETSDPPRKVSRQAFNLFPKILEIDAILRADPAVRPRLIECHPEFSFCRLNNGTPMRTPKKIKGAVSADGIAERVTLLGRHFSNCDVFVAGPPSGAAMDDVVDAAVNLVMAGRHADGLTVPFPSNPARDRYGISIAIHG
jgi:predicted RNase H-like nuclease